MKNSQRKTDTDIRLKNVYFDEDTFEHPSCVMDAFQQGESSSVVRPILMK